MTATNTSLKQSYGLSDSEVLDSNSQFEESTLELSLINQNRKLIPIFNNIFIDINNLLHLPKNWNSYQAHQISPIAAESMFEILSELLKPDTPQPSIVPSTDGNLQAEWHTLNIDLEIEVSSPTLIHVYFRDLITNEEDEHILSTDLSKLSEYINLLTIRNSNSFQ